MTPETFKVGSLWETPRDCSLDKQNSPQGLEGEKGGHCKLMIGSLQLRRIADTQSRVQAERLAKVEADRQENMKKGTAKAPKNSRDWLCEVYLVQVHSKMCLSASTHL